MPRTFTSVSDHRGLGSYFKLTFVYQVRTQRKLHWGWRVETRFPGLIYIFLMLLSKVPFLLGSPSYCESLLFLSQCRIAPFCRAALSREAQVLSVDVGVLPFPAPYHSWGYFLFLWLPQFGILMDFPKPLLLSPHSWTHSIFALCFWFLSSVSYGFQCTPL